MERKIWIIGAGGFAFDIASKFIEVPGEGNIFMGFIDSRDDVAKSTMSDCIKFNVPAIVEHPDDFDFSDPSNRFMFGVGDAKYKKEFAAKYEIDPALYHRFEQAPNINKNSELLPSLYWGCKIASNVKVGYACFIDANSVVGHGVSIGNFCHIAVGVIIGGNVSIGEGTYIHSGAIIGNNVAIGENCIVGVGAVVVRRLPPGSKVIAPKSHNIT